MEATELQEALRDFDDYRLSALDQARGSLETAELTHSAMVEAVAEATINELGPAFEILLDSLQIVQTLRRAVEVLDNSELVA